MRRRYAPEFAALTGDGSQARARLLQALTEGVGPLGYFWHGSMTLWAQEKTFGVEEVSGLGNRNRLPIVFTVTCLSGLFNHPATTALEEASPRDRRRGGSCPGRFPRGRRPGPAFPGQWTCRLLGDPSLVLERKRGALRLAICRS